MLEKVMKKYDLYIWRLNGFFVLLVSLSITYFMIVATYDNWSKPSIAKSIDLAIKADKFNLGKIERINDTETVLIPLIFPTEMKLGKDSKLEVRNYLTINLKSQNQKWLLDSSEHVISDKALVFDSGIKDKKKALGLYFVIEKEGKKIVQIQGMDDSGLITVATDVDRFIGAEASQKNIIMFFYSKDSKSFFKTVNLETRAVSSENEIETNFHHK